MPFYYNTPKGKYSPRTTATFDPVVNALCNDSDPRQPPHVMIGEVMVNQQYSVDIEEDRRQVWAGEIDESLFHPFLRMQYGMDDHLGVESMKIAQLDVVSPSLDTKLSSSDADLGGAAPHLFIIKDMCKVKPRNYVPSEVPEEVDLNSPENERVGRLIVNHFHRFCEVYNFDDDYFNDEERCLVGVGLLNSQGRLSKIIGLIQGKIPFDAFQDGRLFADFRCCLPNDDLAPVEIAHPNETEVEGERARAKFEEDESLMSIVEFTLVNREFHGMGIFEFLLKFFMCMGIERGHLCVKVALVIGDQGDEYRELLVEKVYAKLGFCLFLFDELPDQLHKQLEDSGCNLTRIKRGQSATTDGYKQQCLAQYFDFEEHGYIGMIKRGHIRDSDQSNDVLDLISPSGLEGMGFKMSIGGERCSICTGGACDNCSKKTGTGAAGVETACIKMDKMKHKCVKEQARKETCSEESSEDEQQSAIPLFDQDLIVEGKRRRNCSGSAETGPAKRRRSESSHASHCVAQSEIGAGEDKQIPTESAAGGNGSESMGQSFGGDDDVFSIGGSQEADETGSAVAQSSNRGTDVSEMNDAAATLLSVRSVYNEGGPKGGEDSSAVQPPGDGGPRIGRAELEEGLGTSEDGQGLSEEEPGEDGGRAGSEGDQAEQLTQ
ncbi:hypothetical protein THAOC_01031, partial [Thalassiosira oceanica]